MTCYIVSQAGVKLVRKRIFRRPAARMGFGQILLAQYYFATNQVQLTTGLCVSRVLTACGFRRPVVRVLAKLCDIKA